MKKFDECIVCDTDTSGVALWYWTDTEDWESEPPHMAADWPGMTVQDVCDAEREGVDRYPEEVARVLGLELECEPVYRNGDGLQFSCMGANGTCYVFAEYKDDEYWCGVYGGIYSEHWDYSDYSDD